VLVLGLAMFTYSATQFVGGNGFLAIYLCALVLGSSDFIHKRSLLRFYDGQAWLMQIILFLTLGLLVFPSQVFPLMGTGLLIAAFLMFIARPAGVFASLFFSTASLRSKLFISWVGLRGAVPIVFATFPMIAGLDKAGTIFNLVFFISVSSVLLQGTTLPIVAKWLHVTAPPPHVSKTIDKSTPLNKEMREVVISETSSVVGKKIVSLNLSTSIHIISIKRENRYFQPTGSSRLEAGDTLMILYNTEQELDMVIDAFGLK
jgi:cell volume regulation protein A